MWQSKHIHYGTVFIVALCFCQQHFQIYPWNILVVIQIYSKSCYEFISFFLVCSLWSTQEEDLCWKQNCTGFVCQFLGLFCESWNICKLFDVAALTIVECLDAIAIELLEKHKKNYVKGQCLNQTKYASFGGAHWRNMLTTYTFYT